MEVTNLVQQLGGQEAAESLAKGLIGEYGWVVLAALVAILAKDVVIKFAQSILVFFGHGFENDEIIYISGRQARIIRKGVTSTTFYMTDRRTKMVVPNEKLSDLTVEKLLPHNGGDPYLSKGSDPDFVGYEEVPIVPPPMKVQVVDKKPAPRRKR